MHDDEHEPLILLTGGAGQVGHELRRSLASLGRVTAPTRERFDLSDPDTIRGVLDDVRPDVVVNAAAYTAVDRAESEEDAAHAVNAVAPGVIAESQAARGALTVHLSTDYVFDGDTDEPYIEDAPTSPLGVYGRTKLDGEAAVRAVGGRHFVFRTSWVYGLRGKNFLRTILGKVDQGEQLRIVDDQFGAPTWARAIADGIAQSLAVATKHDAPSGVYHLSCRGETTWHDFAKEALERSGRDAAAVTPIPTSDYPTPARRPRRSTLATDKLSAAFGIRMPMWYDALALCLEDEARASDAATG